MDCLVLSLILSEHMIFESVEITNIHLGLLKAFYVFKMSPGSTDSPKVFPDLDLVENIPLSSCIKVRKVTLEVNQ